MRAIRSVALLLSAALLAVVLVAPPAVADRYTESDPAGDMAVQMPHVISAAPTHRRLDIRRVIVRHTTDFVSIRVVLGALTRPRGDEWFGLRGFVKVNREAQPSESVAWEWEVTFDKRHRRQGFRLLILDAAYFEQFGCDGSRDKGFRAAAHYNGNWVTVIIPRRCLALDSYTDVRPRWVQVSVTTMHALGPRRLYFDHLGSQVVGPWHDEGIAHFTPRVYPG